MPSQKTYFNGLPPELCLAICLAIWYMAISIGEGTYQIKILWDLL